MLLYDAHVHLQGNGIVVDKQDWGKGAFYSFPLIQALEEGKQ